MTRLILFALAGGCLKGSLILCAAAVAAALGRRNHPKHLHRLWLTGILCFPLAGGLCLLPFEALRIGVFRSPVLSVVSGVAGLEGPVWSAQTAAAGLGFERAGEAVSAAVNGGYLPLVLLCAWAAVAAALILRNVFAASRIGAMMGKTVETVVDGCRIRIASDSWFPRPFTFGVFHPVIVMPESIVHGPRGDLLLILAHEKAHVRRRDVLALRAAFAVCALFWFVPWIWAALSRLKMEQEKACDLEAAGSKDDGIRFAELLVEAGRTTRLQTAYARLTPQMSGEHGLRERIINVIEGTRRRKLMKKTSIGAFTTIIVLAAAFLGLARCTPAAAQEASVRPPTGPGVTLQWPLGSTAGFPVGRVTLAYGEGENPITHAQWFHRGVDIAAEPGTPVIAAARGVVTETGYSDSAGIFVAVAHAGGFTTTYSHLRKASVNGGQTVEAGQVVGEIGSTGVSTGPHLHFEVISGTEYINPLDATAERG